MITNMVPTGTTPHDFFRRHKPRKGQPLTYENKPVGTVDHVDRGSEICFFTDTHGQLICFVWCFREGLNIPFGWPTKSAPTDQPEPE